MKLLIEVGGTDVDNEFFNVIVDFLCSNEKKKTSASCTGNVPHILWSRYSATWRNASAFRFISYTHKSLRSTIIIIGCQRLESGKYTRTQPH